MKPAAKRPAVTADDRALAEQLYIAFHCPDAGPATEGIAKVLSALHERAVACAAVRVSRELQSTKEKRKP